MEKKEFREKKRLEEAAEKLDRDLDSIIVEGLRDKQVMERLGFNGKIFLSAERSVEDLVEDVARGSERVGILTDFDSHGRQKNLEISRELDKKVDVIQSSRKDFGALLTSNGRRCIEDIEPLFSSWDQKFVDAALDGIFFRDIDA